MRLSDFPVHSHDKIRYGDCDPQGHVNNAVFTTFIETGRSDLLAAGFGVTGRARDSFVVLARLELDYVAEILWPGQVEIGTAVARLGNSSVQIEQVIFQEDKLVAKAKSVLVHLGADKRPAALPDYARAGFEKLLRTGA